MCSAFSCSGSWVALTFHAGQARRFPDLAAVVCCNVSAVLAPKWVNCPCCSHANRHQACAPRSALSSSLSATRLAGKMKLLRKALEKNGQGEIAFIPTEPEDMWHAYNLIAVGDSIRATTIRKVQRESTTGSVDSQKVRTTLCVSVLDVEFDVDACSLRVKGRNIEENPFVKMGAHHTIDMELQRKVTLIKDEWDSVSIERLGKKMVRAALLHPRWAGVLCRIIDAALQPAETACDPTKHADLAAVVMDEGEQLR